MARKSTRPKALRQIEDCMVDLLFHVNDDGQLVMTHPDKFNQSDVELLKVWDGKTPQPAEKTKSKS